MSPDDLTVERRVIEDPSANGLIYVKMSVYDNARERERTM